MLVMLGACYYHHHHYFYCAAVLSVYLCRAQLPCHLVKNIMVFINAHYVLEFSCGLQLKHPQACGTWGYRDTFEGQFRI